MKDYTTMTQIQLARALNRKRAQRIREQDPAKRNRMADEWDAMWKVYYGRMKPLQQCVEEFTGKAYEQA